MSLQIYKTLSQEQQLNSVWKAVHTTPFLYARFTSQLFTKNDDIRNPLVFILCLNSPIIVQKSNLTRHKQQCQCLFHSSKNYHKLVNKKNRLQFTRIINIVTHGCERTPRFGVQCIEKENKKAAGEWWIDHFPVVKMDASLTPWNDVSHPQMMQGPLVRNHCSKLIPRSDYRVSWFRSSNFFFGRIWTQNFCELEATVGMCRSTCDWWAAVFCRWKRCIGGCHLCGTALNQSLYQGPGGKHGRWKDYFHGVATSGFSKILAGGGKKWWNSLFPTQN